MIEKVVRVQAFLKRAMPLSCLSEPDAHEFEPLCKLDADEDSHVSLGDFGEDSFLQEKAVRRVTVLDGEVSILERRPLYIDYASLLDIQTFLAAVPAAPSEEWIDSFAFHNKVQAQAWIALKNRADRERAALAENLLVECEDRFRRGVTAMLLGPFFGEEVRRLSEMQALLEALFLRIRIALFLLSALSLSEWNARLETLKGPTSQTLGDVAARVRFPSWLDLSAISPFQISSD